MFDIENLTEENIDEWIKDNIEDFEKAKPYPKGVFAQYHWWLKIIKIIIISFQIKEDEIKKSKEKENNDIEKNKNQNYKKRTRRNE